MLRPYKRAAEEIYRRLGHDDLHDGFAPAGARDRSGLRVGVAAAANERRIADAPRMLAAGPAGGSARHQAAVNVPCDRADRALLVYVEFGKVTGGPDASRPGRALALNDQFFGRAQRQALLRSELLGSGADQHHVLARFEHLARQANGVADALDRGDRAGAERGAVHDHGVELDAILMDGAELKAGAVAAVERVRNPIRLARKVLESCEHMMLVGAGAEQFAVEQGIPLCAPEELVIERERSAWQRCREGDHSAEFHLSHEHGTVGAVARDLNGRLVAGTSTGGTCCKRPGRVGDSPLVGCGCYADAEAGAVSCTGWGEAIMKIVMAKTAVDLLRPPLVGAQHAAPVSSASHSSRATSGETARLSPQAAAEACVRLLLDRAHGRGGLILLDRDGRPGFAFNTSRMAYAYMSADSSVVVAP